MVSARRLILLAVAVALMTAGTAAHAAAPSWTKPALHYLAERDWLDRETFRPNKPMSRRAFRSLMVDAFGGGYHRRKGRVRAREVSRALVRALGQEAVAEQLMKASSPDGWSPERPPHLGYEVVAREMGLRHDRPTDEDRFEASARQRMTQADVAWAVWRAKTAPSTWGAQALESFSLPDYGRRRRTVIEFALSLVGKPYVWGGEWPAATPPGYPYGSQVHGGFDCSGFIWYVLRTATASYDPLGRPYPGWTLPERSSSEMAKATPTKQRLGYRQLLPADIVLFAPRGRDSRPSDVYHAGLYLGRGWMIHSSGSRAGVSISSLGPGAWWHDQLIFGRRVLPS